MKPALAWSCALAVLVVTGCSGVTSGSGHPQPGTTAGTTAGTTDFPTTTSGEPNSSPISSPAASPPATTHGTAARPTIKQRDDRLTTQTNGEAHVLVAVAGGAEAATYDTGGNIQFWRSTGSSVNWTQLGASTYPAEVDGQPYDVTVTGARLSGMRDATFIVEGQFTNDNSGHAVAYTTGSRGWGAIKAEADGNIGPSGKPVGADQIGLSYDFGFVGGKLKTEDCATNQPIANCGSDHVDKLWAWTGHDFKKS